MSSIQSPTDVPLQVSPPTTTPTGAPIKQPLFPPGQYVRLNTTTQDPRAAKPSPEEQGLGQVRQSFTRTDGPYYQVVWNSGDALPKSALYHGDSLCPLTPQEANQIKNAIAAGTFTADTGTPGSAFQQPNVPVQAAPPEAQPTGEYSL